LRSPKIDLVPVQIEQIGDRAGAETTSLEKKLVKGLLRALKQKKASPTAVCCKKSNSKLPDVVAIRDAQGTACGPSTNEWDTCAAEFASNTAYLYRLTRRKAASAKPHQQTRKKISRRWPQTALVRASSLTTAVRASRRFSKCGKYVAKPSWSTEPESVNPTDMTHFVLVDAVCWKSSIRKKAGCDGSVAALHDR
jgi:hypothetical protein